MHSLSHGLRIDGNGRAQHIDFLSMKNEKLRVILSKLVK